MWMNGKRHNDKLDDEKLNRFSDELLRAFEAGDNGDQYGGDFAFPLPPHSRAHRSRRAAARRAARRLAGVADWRQTRDTGDGDACRRRVRVRYDALTFATQTAEEAHRR